MGVKISGLPINALPYTGAEKIPLVQGSTTKAGTLSSLTNYLSGNFAVKNANNNFTNTQTISVVDTTRIVFGGFKAVIDQSNANILFGYNVTSTDTGTYNISIGIKANSTGTDNIVIGNQGLGTEPVMFGTPDSSNIAIGQAITVSTINNVDNILIGRTALNALGTSSNNIVIGPSSQCNLNATGSNVVVGHGSTASHNYCIVFGYAASTTMDNQLALGNLNVSAGSLVLDNYTAISIGGTAYYLPLASSL